MILVKILIIQLKKKLKFWTAFFGKDYNSKNNKFKTELFCMKCDNELGNLITDEKGQRHCIDKNVIILKKLIK
jgi:peptide methionine sulfoxide reductase MsrB